MRVFHQKNAENGKQYYNASDYYAGGSDQLKGYFIGKGAAELNLTGEVNKDFFDRMVDNLHPFEERSLTSRTIRDRRCLTDITFSAPKSVSLLWAFSGDNRLLDAVNDAARNTINDFEKDVLTRVNIARGVLETRKTGNLIGATWLHTSGRPVDGHPDPQLHVHASVMNATKIGKDKWSAIDLSSVVKDSGYYEAIFQNRLAQNIQALGYQISRNKTNFEVTGISRALIQKFSRRQGQIEKLAKELDIHDPDVKGLLGATSRSKDKTSLPIPKLRKIWQSRLTDDEKKELQPVMMQQIPIRQNVETAKSCVDYASQHCFTRQSVCRQRQILKEALGRGIGDVSAEEIHDEVYKRPWVKKGKEESTLISTREILEEERALLRFARNGRGSVSPLARNHTIKRDWLSDEQKTAIDGLLKSKDRLQILRGVAGVGKTTIMSEAVEAIEEAGTSVTVLAPTAVAARQLLPEEGFKSQTLAAFLMNPKLQEEAQNSVLFVDEAGLAGSQDMAKLCQVSKQNDARIIIVGDKRQHKSVARGKPLELLESQAGIKPLEIKTIRRQEKDEYRKAVTFMSEGKIEEGFDILKELGSVHEIKDSEERYSRMAKRYADNTQAGEKTLVIAPTHAERHLVTDAIRGELKARKMIGAKDHDLSILKSKQLTPAQRQDIANYQEGDIVEFVRRGKGGFKAGDRLEVVGFDGNQVLAKGKHGVQAVPMEKPDSFDVYSRKESSFAVGDIVRVTKSDTKNKIYNGNLATIKHIYKNGKVKLDNDKTLDPKFGHFEHGITITSYSSQGKSYPKVLVAQSSLSFPASDTAQIYVTASRGKIHIEIFTDDIHGLKKAVQRSRNELMATDLVRDNHVERLANQVKHIRSVIGEVIKRQKEQYLQWASHQQLQGRQI